MKNFSRIALMSICLANTLFAAVTLDFNVDSAYEGSTNRIYAGSGQTILLDFTIDGSGNVELEASTTSTESNVVSTVTNWNGMVGAVANAELFGEAFTLRASAYKNGSPDNIVFDGVGAGVLGIQGRNSSRIDDAPDAEALTWTLESGAVELDILSFTYGNASAGDSDFRVVCGTETNTYYDLPEIADTEALSGFSLTGSSTLTFTEPADGSNGCGLAGFSFDVSSSGPTIPDRTNGLPNVVVIIADDLGYSDISYNPYSAPEVSTPNIDALIRSGVWFSDAYASGNLCAPSRAGFFIGSYQHRVGIHEEADVREDGIPYSMPIFPEHLKQANDGVLDYVCTMLGKWHMGRDRTATVTVDGNTDGDYIDWGTKISFENDHELEPYPVNMQPPNDDDWGQADPNTTLRHPMNRGFDHVYGFLNLGGASYWDYDIGFYEDYYRHEAYAPIDGTNDSDSVETYLTTRLTDKACEFIQTNAASGKPFYVHLAYNAVHTPMHAPASPEGLSEGDPGWFPDADWFNTNYPNMWATPSYANTRGSQYKDQYTRAIEMAMLYHMDQGIGRVVGTLKSTGEWENTIVVFWSDNGGSQASRASNDPLRERKHFNYEGGIRVPMCLNWPGGLGTNTNTVVSAPVMSIDIVPTVLDAAGIEPINGFDAMDGKSLLPLIRGEADSIHDALFWSEGNGSGDGEYAVRQGDWKLYESEDQFELYNLAEDIGETNDLAAVYPEKVRELRQKLFAWASEMVTASGETLEDRMWIFETPAPNIGPANMMIEEFDYSPGSLSGAGGGSGWSDAWNGSGDMRVASNSLSFNNPYYGNGEPNGRSSDDETSSSPFTWKRTFAETVSSGAVWLSSLSSYDPDNSGGSAANDNAWQSILINGDESDHLTIFGGNGNRYPGPYDDVKLTDAKNDDSLLPLVSAQSVFTDTVATYLHIVKLETNVSGGNDRVTWYATSNTNGLTGTTVADLESAVLAGTLKKVIGTSSDGDWWGDSLSSLGIQVNNSSANPLVDMSVDNIRVVYGLDDDTALAALLSGDTGIEGSLPAGHQLQKSRVAGGRFEIEHDEKAGWYPGGVVYEATDSLTNSWTPVTPESVEQTDRYLDLESYRVTFPIDQPQQYFRIKDE